MRRLLQVVVQASGAAIALAHGNEAAVLHSLASLGILGLLRQMESRPVRP
jgi:hypothetical protein